MIEVYELRSCVGGPMTWRALQPVRAVKDVQTVEMNALFDKAVQPVTGKTSDEMNIVRHRIKLGAQDQHECSRLDATLPDLEAAAASATAAAKGRADVDLYQARKRFFDLKC